jgi:hypothetical protein
MEFLRPSGSVTVVFIRIPLARLRTGAPGIVLAWEGPKLRGRWRRGPSTEIPGFPRELPDRVRLR